jgi:hypothetical protein
LILLKAIGMFFAIEGGANVVYWRLFGKGVKDKLLLADGQDVEDCSRNRGTKPDQKYCLGLAEEHHSHSEPEHDVCWEIRAGPPGFKEFACR